jgi:small subunit ribosomal protein S11
MSEVKKKVKKNIPLGTAYVVASFNNTIVSIATMSGDVIAWSSSGVMGFKGSKKSTPYAAQLAAEDACKKAKELGLKTVFVKVKGPGSGRESAIRGIESSGIVVTGIEDITPVPHNGVRPAKRRRV